MQRVRIGLTGLAFVFVLVLVAAVFSNVSEREEPITANRLEQIANNQLPAQPDDDPEPKEPLAKLGVAPGNADNSSAGAEPPAAME